MAATQLLSGERKAFANREARRQQERMARRTLQEVGHSASIQELEEWAKGRWGLSDREAAKVGLIANRIRREVQASTRHLTTLDIQEEAAVKGMAQKLRDTTRKYLESHPEMPRQDMYLRVMHDTGADNKLSSWEVTYYYPERRRLRAEASSGTEADPPPTGAAKAEEDDRQKVGTDLPVDEAKAVPEVDRLRPADLPTVHFGKGSEYFRAEKRGDGLWTVDISISGLTDELAGDFVNRYRSHFLGL